MLRKGIGPLVWRVISSLLSARVALVSKRLSQFGRNLAAIHFLSELLQNINKPSCCFCEFLACFPKALSLVLQVFRTSKERHICWIARLGATFEKTPRFLWPLSSQTTFEMLPSGTFLTGHLFAQLSGQCTGARAEHTDQRTHNVAS